MLIIFSNSEPFGPGLSLPKAGYPLQFLDPESGAVGFSLLSFSRLLLWHYQIDKTKRGRKLMLKAD